MATAPGSGQSRASLEVPHPLGVRDLKRERFDLDAALASRKVEGKQRRLALGELVFRRLAEHWEGCEGPAEGVALGAVGSIGRSDAGPASDLDLILVHDGVTHSKEAIASLAQRLWYPIWDAGLDLDHSVRSIEDCRQVASRDLAAAAGLLDVARIAGDTEVLQRAQSAIFADWRTAARQRLPDLLESSRERAERFGELAYLIEPNLKESRGGLRDVVGLSALAATWLADRPHGALDVAADYLLDVRDSLQRVTKLPQVILGRHVASRVAQDVGVDSADDLLASLADAGRRVAYAVDLTERDARRSLAKSGRGSVAFLARKRNAVPRYRPVARSLIEVDGDLALATDARPEEDSVLPLRAAAVAATTGYRPTPGLLAAIRSSPDLPVPWPAEARERFMELLRGSANLVTVWEALDLSGCIVRWIPEWEGIRNRPQRSPVHRFTVDRHSIEAVVRAGALLDTVEDPDLFLFATLFHDVGKIAGAADHSIVGASLVPTIAARMGLSEKFATDAEILVRHHLLLVDLATKRNPESPKTATALLAALEHRRDRVVTLRALTEADAIAAGPKAWGPWRQKLVDALMRTIEAQLDATARTPGA
jgi:[protein-PII] uridylyltransferase